MIDQKETIIDRVQKDTGKSRGDALVSEIFAVVDYLDFLVKSSGKLLSPERVPTPIALFPRKSKVYYEPMGTILVIVPWNYPFYLGVIPCLAGYVAGNAVILKPSEVTPLEGLFEELLRKAGFESDWIQVVYGEGDIGKQLIDQRPDKIFFTGGTETGKKIMAHASQYLIPVGLELGGKDPMIVFEDANIERATAGAMWGGFCNAGQTCTSVERCYVQESIYGEFVKRMVEKTSKLTLGTDQDGESDVGRMTTRAQIEKVKSQLDDAVSKGAKQLTGKGWDGKSEFVPPIVLTDVPDDALVMQEETFGPIVPILKFSSEEEACDLANKSQYGLSASVWTADQRRAERVARAITTGNVSINNVMLTQGNSHLPFGGVKDSGFGRTKGTVGLRGFTNPKSVIFDSNSSKIEPNWHPYTSKKYGMLSKVTEFLFGGGFVGLVLGALTAVKLELYASKVGKKGRS